MTRDSLRRLTRIFRKVGAMTPKQYANYRKAEKSTLCRKSKNA